MQNAYASQTSIAALAQLLQDVRDYTVHFVGGRSRREPEFDGQPASQFLFVVHD
jgi:hypothetical protein